MNYTSRILITWFFIQRTATRTWQQRRSESNMAYLKLKRKQIYKFWLIKHICWKPILIGRDQPPGMATSIFFLSCTKCAERELNWWKVETSWLIKSRQIIGIILRCDFSLMSIQFYQQKDLRVSLPKYGSKSCLK